MLADAPALMATDDCLADSGPTERREKRVVVVVGPSPNAIGGMAGVMEMMAALDLGAGWRIELFAATASPSSSERLAGRIKRHIGHLSLLGRTLRDHRASVIHIHTCSGVSLFRSAADMLLAQRLGCKVILHIHGARFDEFFENAGIVGRPAIRWILNRAQRVIALSPEWRQRLQTMAPQARLAVVENACVIPDGLPVHNHEGPCRLLLLAKMDAWKGIDDLLEACARLGAAACRFELVLAGPAGSAGDSDALNRKIQVKGLETSVRYIGPVIGEAKLQLLRWADVYVQPSHSEGMPLAILEAMAYRLPVVATTVGAVPEVVDDGATGLLVPPRCPEQLADAMSQLIRDSRLRTRMGTASGELAAARFSPERFRNALVTLYDGLAPKESQAGRLQCPRTFYQQAALELR